MAKYCKRLVEVIVELIENDMSVTDICRSVGITRKTFYEWKATKPAFGRAVDDARERAYEELIALARRTLRERIEGYTIEETTYTYEPASYDENELVLKKKVVKQKRKEASITALSALVERYRSESKISALTDGDHRVKKGHVNPTTSKEAFILANFLKKVESGRDSISTSVKRRKEYNNV